MARTYRGRRAVLRAVVDDDDFGLPGDLGQRALQRLDAGQQQVATVEVDDDRGDEHYAS
jgi:hypothetical protein